MRLGFAIFVCYSHILHCMILYLYVYDISVTCVTRRFYLHISSLLGSSLVESPQNINS